MGAITKVIDAIMFMNYVMMALVTPLIDSQTCFPAKFYPDVLIRVRNWYTEEAGDFLFTEKPFFFVGMTWLEILVHWPIVLFALYGFLASKPWYSTLCLIYGTSISTAMVGLLAELLGSGRASTGLMMNYYPSMAVAMLAILRGLMPHPAKAASATKAKPSSTHKKKA